MSVRRGAKPSAPNFSKASLISLDWLRLIWTVTSLSGAHEVVFFSMVFESWKPTIYTSKSTGSGTLTRCPTVRSTSPQYK
jgi:hypothetical protein